SQKFASSFLRTSSAVGSLQCFAYDVSYSRHILHTCNSALHALQTSRRRSGKLSAAKDAPQCQQTRECVIDGKLCFWALMANLHVPERDKRGYLLRRKLEVMLTAKSPLGRY